MAGELHSADSAGAYFCLLIAYLWIKRMYPTDKREEREEIGVWWLGKR